jgi:hypothetical protein
MAFVKIPPPSNSDVIVAIRAHGGGAIGLVSDSDVLRLARIAVPLSYKLCPVCPML